MINWINEKKIEIAIVIVTFAILAALIIPVIKKIRDGNTFQKNIRGKVVRIEFKPRGKGPRLRGIYRPAMCVAGDYIYVISESSAPAMIFRINRQTGDRELVSW